MRYLINTFVTYVLIGMFALHPLSAASLLDHILENFPPEQRKAFSREKHLVRVSLISCPEYDFYVSQPHARRFLNIYLHGNPLREKKEEEKAYSVFFEINNRVQWILNIQEQAVVRFLNDVFPLIYGLLSHPKSHLDSFH